MLRSRVSIKISTKIKTAVETSLEMLRCHFQSIKISFYKCWDRESRLRPRQDKLRVSIETMSRHIETPMLNFKRPFVIDPCQSMHKRGLSPQPSQLLWKKEKGKRLFSPSTVPITLPTITCTCFQIVEALWNISLFEAVIKICFVF